MSLVFLVLSTSSIFISASLNIKSEYFKAQSYLLIVLGVSLIAINVYIFKIFSNKYTYVRTKKLSIVFLIFTCLCIAGVSLSYIIRVNAFNLCGNALNISDSQEYTNTRISFKIEMTNADKVDDILESSGQIKIIHTINNE
ncbi:hypothetical protein ABPG72_006485 [Tetrahymena utriculariae]